MTVEIRCRVANHVHVCEHCFCSFSHDKAKLPRGRENECHRCPSCARFVNSDPLGERLTGEIPVDFVDWYGFDEEDAEDGSCGTKTKSVERFG